jgi:hypothetical protein
MSKSRIFIMTTTFLTALGFISTVNSALRNNPEDYAGSGATDVGSANDSTIQEAIPATETSTNAETSITTPADATPPSPSGELKPVSNAKGKRKILTGVDGFIAGPEWEFDGFVAGGQDQEIKSMYVVNDLLYLNVGFAQGIQAGDRLGIYKRGGRIRDPQTGMFLGYEVRRVAVAEVTDKIDDETCSARVVRSNDTIEVGDLVRRE